MVPDSVKLTLIEGPYPETDESVKKEGIKLFRELKIKCPNFQEQGLSPALRSI